MNFNDWNLSNEDWIYLAIVIIFSFLCTMKMMLFTMSGGILDPDTALYLLSGLKYAGLDFYNVVNPQDLFYTPVISFLSSLFFRMGYVDKNAIIIVTGIIGFMGYIGLYILLKNRFSPLLSLTGVIIFGGFSIVTLNIAKGLLDVAVVALSIWVLVFAVMAIDKNPKYFFIAFPLLVVAFFTKYVAGFMLPLILLYYCMQRDIVGKFDCLLCDKSAFKQMFKNYLHSREFKYIVLSLLISLILTILICKTLILDFGGSLTFFNQSVETFNGQDFSAAAINFNIDKSYYLDHLTEILFERMDAGHILAKLLYGICGLGLIIKAIMLIKNFSKIKSEKKSFKTKYLDKILLILTIILLFISFFTFKVIPNHMISNICMLISLTFIYSLLEKYGVDNKILALDLLFLAYLLVNFIFSSLYSIKVPRYAIPFIPPIIYFIILGLEGIVENINVNRLSGLKLNKTIPIVLIVIFLISTTTFIAPIEYDRSNDVVYAINYMGFKGDVVDACDFISDNDSDYHNESFASFYHHSRLIRWYLNVNVTSLDKLPDLESYDNTTYIILNKDIDFKNYHKIKTCGDLIIYHHN